MEGSSQQDQALEVQDAPSSPESEATVLTEDLPHTADWVALRQRNASQLQSLSVASSFDSQETVLTEDLPNTNDWLRLRKSRDHHISNAATTTTTTSPTAATRAKNSNAKPLSSPPEAAKSNTTELAPTKVTPPFQNDAHRRDQAQNVKRPTTVTCSNNENIDSNMKNHRSPMRDQWKADPISPLTQDLANSQSQQSNGWIQGLPHQRTKTEESHTTHTVSSSPPSLFPKNKQPQSPQSPQSPADSILSDPLFSAQTRNTKKRPLLSPPFTQNDNNTNDKDNTDDSSNTIPSPPPKKQPWFQKKRKTKKRNLQQMRLKFG
ncbi:unnamed protein product [Cylindrotheca closterium]|uniref:Uncharacterized protein n=1 Tax=Cylindrotheca closterium TaxID=2856 RepID=A0AAD2FD72_9STRA|nr:unnamed protein product [Cylindrotheca closterium]